MGKIKRIKKKEGIKKIEEAIRKEKKLDGKKKLEF